MTWRFSSARVLTQHHIMRLSYLCNDSEAAWLPSCRKHLQLQQLLMVHCRLG